MKTVRILPADHAYFRPSLQRGEFGALRHRAKAYTLLVSDSVRVQNRIKSLFRSRGVAVAGKSVFSKAEREAWLEKLPVSARSLAELLMQKQDGLLELRRKAEKAMLSEARRHRAWQLVKSCPGLGEIRIGISRALRRPGTPGRMWAGRTGGVKNSGGGGIPGGSRARRVLTCGFRAHLR